jgi:hypothetical protein
MHVPHATNFYGKFENLIFDIFCKKLFQIKSEITFATDSKKHIIYEKLSMQKVTSDSIAVGRLHKLLFLKIPKGNMKARNFRFCQKKILILDFFLKFLNLFYYFF